MGEVKPYGPWSRDMLEGLKRDGDLKTEAFVAWLDENDIHIGRTLVSHWSAGRSHLPADLLPRLAAFTESPEGVFGPYLREAGCALVRLPDAAVPDDDALIKLVLEVGAGIGHLQRALIEALHPDSPGGEEVTREEREILRQRLHTVIQQLVDMRAVLDLDDAPPD